MSIACYYMLKGRHLDFARKTFVIGLVVGTFFSLAAPLQGHFQADTVAKHQPAKLAAFEGLYHTTEGGTPMSLFGLVDEDAQTVRYEIAVPGLLSFLLYGDASKPVPGLDRIPREDRPPVALSYTSYHLMVMLGMYFILLCALAWFFILTKSFVRQRWLQWLFVFSVLGPFAANQLGWVAAEVGRQPWIVYGLLRTRDGVSKAVAAEQVLASIILFGVIYLLLFAVWVVVLNAKIKHGPEDEYQEIDPNQKRESWLDAAAALAAHGGSSMTESGGADRAPRR
jgi:cytochrome d ubiquinol oxidase subunit I